MYSKKFPPEKITPEENSLHFHVSFPAKFWKQYYTVVVPCEVRVTRASKSNHTGTFYTREPGKAQKLLPKTGTVHAVRICTLICFPDMEYSSQPVSNHPLTSVMKSSDARKPYGTKYEGVNKPDVMTKVVPCARYLIKTVKISYCCTSYGYG